MVKPDGVQRALIGNILQRIEEKGFKIVAMKLAVMPVEKAKAHYAEHVGKKILPGPGGFHHRRAVRIHGG
jgi:nucleoside-diphosphate kinase